MATQVHSSILSRFLAALLLPSLIYAAEIKSNNNLLYSFYSPSKTKFINFTKGHYILNDKLEKAYKNPDGTVYNAFLNATAMDYVYSDGSDTTKRRYEFGAMKKDMIFAMKTMPRYMDFLLRTNRHEDIKSIPRGICEADQAQCDYYRAASLHISHRSISSDICISAKKFKPMRKITKLFCN